MQENFPTPGQQQEMLHQHGGVRAGPSVRLLLALLRRGSWDADVFFKFRHEMIEGSQHAQEKQQLDMAADLWHIMAHHYPLTPHKDVAFEIGRVLMGLRRYDEAVHCFLESQRLWGEHHVSWYNMGICHHFSGDHCSAIACFTRALAINPRYSDASMWRNESIRHMQKSPHPVSSAAYLQSLPAPLLQTMVGAGTIGDDAPLTRHGVEEDGQDEAAAAGGAGGREGGRRGDATVTVSVRVPRAVWRSPSPGPEKVPATSWRTVHLRVPADMTVEELRSRLVMREERRLRTEAKSILQARKAAEADARKAAEATVGDKDNEAEAEGEKEDEENDADAHAEATGAERKEDADKGTAATGGDAAQTPAESSSGHERANRRDDDDGHSDGVEHEGAMTSGVTATDTVEALLRTLRPAAACPPWETLPKVRTESLREDSFFQMGLDDLYARQSRLHTHAAGTAVIEHVSVSPECRRFHLMERGPSLEPSDRIGDVLAQAEASAQSYGGGLWGTGIVAVGGPATAWAASDSRQTTLTPATEGEPRWSVRLVLTDA